MKSKALVTFALAMALGVAMSAQESKRPMKTQGKPAYPELAKRMNVAGAVKVEVVVAPNGSVKSIASAGLSSGLEPPASPQPSTISAFSACRALRRRPGEAARVTKPSSGAGPTRTPHRPWPV